MKFPFDEKRLNIEVEGVQVTVEPYDSNPCITVIRFHIPEHSIIKEDSCPTALLLPYGLAVPLPFKLKGNLLPEVTHYNVPFDVDILELRVTPREVPIGHVITICLVAEFLIECREGRQTVRHMLGSMIGK